MALTIDRLQTFTIIDCANCGLPFGITVDYERRRRDDHQRFYCPSGHWNVYNGPSQAEKRAQRAEAEAEQLRRSVANYDESLRIERASHAATKGQLTKVRKRAEAAVCPYCPRSFVQLRRHISSKHPEHAHESFERRS